MQKTRERAVADGAENAADDMKDAITPDSTDDSTMLPEAPQVQTDKILRYVQTPGEKESLSGGRIPRGACDR